MERKETFISRQTKRLSKGQIDRRRFVMSALATGVTMPTAMSLARRAEAMVPKRGGMLRLAVADGWAGDRIDPAVAASEMALAVNRARCSRLVELPDDGGIAGDLAENTDVEDQGRTWVFTLRADVRFHSGKPLTPEDVIASFRHATTRSPPVARVLAGIERIDSDGHRRLVFRLKTPDPGFARFLSLPHLSILPSKDGRVNPDDLDGTGPYRVQSFTAGEEAELQRNSDDWRSDRGFFDHIRLLAMPDTNRRLGAMMNGEVDAIDRVDPRSLALLSSLPGIDIHEATGTRHMSIELPAVPLGLDPRHLRAALKVGTDRKAILTNAFLGHGAVGADVPRRAAEAQDVLDPDLAHWHWRNAGASGPLPINLQADTNSAVTMAFEVLEASLRASGIEVRQAAEGENAIVARMRQGRSCADAHYAAMFLPKAALSVAPPMQAQMERLILPVWINDLTAHASDVAIPEGLTETVDLLTTGWIK